MSANFFNIRKGSNIQPVTGSTVTVQGDLAYNSSTNQLELFTTGAESLTSASNTQTLTNKTISGSSNTLSSIANASLTNSSITVGSTSISLGGTAATVSGLTVASGTFTGTSTFPGTSSIDSSGNAVFGGNVTAKGSANVFGTTSSSSGFILTINSNTSGGSGFGGIKINCGTTLNSESPLIVGNAASTVNYFSVLGDGSTSTAGSVSMGFFNDSTVTGISTQNAFPVISKSIVAFNGSATITFNGVAGGVSGQMLTIFNNTGNVMTFTNLNASGTQKFVTPGGISFIVSQGGGMTAFCNGSNWLIVSK